MKRFVWTLGILCTGAIVAIAQPPGGPRSGGGQGGPGGGQGGPGFGRGDFQPPPSPIVEALDTDGDHVISSAEIQNAPTSLLKVDTNKDGKLTEDEFRPHPPGGGPGGQQGMRGNGNGNGNGNAQRSAGQRNQGAGQGQGGGRAGGPGGGAGGPQGPGGGPAGPERFVEHAMEFDADKDGKLNRDELAKFADAFAQRRGGPGGPGGPNGGPGGPPGGGPGSGQGNGGSSARPSRPE